MPSSRGFSSYHHPSVIFVLVILSLYLVLSCRMILFAPKLFSYIFFVAERSSLDDPQVVDAMKTLSRSRSPHFLGASNPTSVPTTSSALLVNVITTAAILLVIDTPATYPSSLVFDLTKKPNLLPQLNKAPNLDQEISCFDSPRLEELLNSLPLSGSFHCPILPHMQNPFIICRLNQSCLPKVGPTKVEWSNVWSLHEVAFFLYITQLNVGLTLLLVSNCIFFA